MTLVLNHDFSAALCANRLSIEASDCIVSEDLAVRCSLMETGQGQAESSGTGQSPPFCLGDKVIRMAAATALL